MSRFVLDTSAYSNFQRGDPQIIELIDSADWLGVPYIVLGELELGFRLATEQRRERNRSTLRQFMGHPMVEALGLDELTSWIYAEIVATLRKRGRPLPTNDVWIAAIAARQGTPVLTYDHHFAVIERIGSVILTPSS